MKKIIKIITVNFLVLLLFLFLVEIGFRIFNSPQKEWWEADASHTKMMNGKPLEKPIQKPDRKLGMMHNSGVYELEYKVNDGSVPPYHCSYTIDESGHRITSLHPEKYNNNPEIWLFGCSYIFGIALNDNETMAWLLQEKLDDYKVVNYGIGSRGPITFYKYLENALKENKKPALAVFNFGSFQFFRSLDLPVKIWWLQTGHFVGVNENGDFVVNFIKKPRKKSLFIRGLSKMSQKSLLFNWVNNRVINYLNENIKSKELEITSWILDKIVNLCRENNIQLLFTDIGWEKSKFLYDYTKQNKVDYLYLGVRNDTKEYNLLPYDGHPNAKCNVIYTKKLHQYLKEKKLIE